MEWLRRGSCHRKSIADGQKVVVGVAAAVADTGRVVVVVGVAVAVVAELDGRKPDSPRVLHFEVDAAGLRVDAERAGRKIVGTDHNHLRPGSAEVPVVGCMVPP